MGEAKKRASATARLIIQHPRCCFCAEARETETREHMPPKAMFDGSHRPDDLVLPACKICNEGTRTADLVTSIIARWRFGQGSDEEREDHKRLVDRLRGHSAPIVQEWLKAAGKQDEVRRHLGKFIPLPRVGGFASVGPETIRQLNIFAHKLVLGLYFYRHRKPLGPTGCLWAFWKTKEDILYSGPPDFLLKLLPDYGALIQGTWDTKATFGFTTGQDRDEGTFGCFARFRGGLVMGGFSVNDRSALGKEGRGWTSPTELLEETKSPRFTTRDLE